MGRFVGLDASIGPKTARSYSTRVIWYASQTLLHAAAEAGLILAPKSAKRIEHSSGLQLGHFFVASTQEPLNVLGIGMIPKLEWPTDRLGAPLVDYTLIGIGTVLGAYIVYPGQQSISYDLEGKKVNGLSCILIDPHTKQPSSLRWNDWTMILQIDTQL